MEYAPIGVTRVSLDDGLGITVIFDDGTFARYPAEELAALRPHRERALNASSKPDSDESIGLDAQVLLNLDFVANLCGISILAQRLA